MRPLLFAEFGDFVMCTFNILVSVFLNVSLYLPGEETRTFYLLPQLIFVFSFKLGPVITGNIYPSLSINNSTPELCHGNVLL